MKNHHFPSMENLYSVIVSDYIKFPASDYEDAMEYFTEYFEDADEEGTATLIRELGTPKEAARDLMANLLDKKLTEKDGNPSDTPNH